MIRARVFRDGPGAWAFSIVDDEGLPFVIGNAGSFSEAWDAAAKELKIFAGLDRQQPPLISPAAQERSWLARLLGVAA